MKVIRLIGNLIVCFALFGFAFGGVSAEETPFVWDLEGSVYYMISPPYMPQDRDPQESLTDNLGAYDETQWRFFRYDPEEGIYAELKSPDWNPVKHDFDFGRGYWIISVVPATIDIGGEPVAKRWVLLEHKGTRWNQIGNIHDYDFPIVSLYVARESTPFNQKQLIDPVNNDLTYVTLQEFESGGYIDIPAPGKTHLKVGKGYWLRVEEGVGEDVVLWFLAQESSIQPKEIYLREEFSERVAQQDPPPDPPPGITSPSSGSSGSSSGGCFIATAAYGGYDHPMVQLMREFRDRYLLANSFGRVFVDMYYRYSPALARVVAKRELIKALIRVNMIPIVGTTAILSKMNLCGFLLVVAFSFLGSLFFLRRRKGAWGECKLRLWGTMREKRRA